MPVKTRNVFGCGGVLLLTLGSLAAANSDLRLVEAVKDRNPEAVRALLAQHINVNTSQPDGTTPLHWATHWDDLETVGLLLRAGANVNAANDYGVTPLSLGCTNGNEVMVDELLKAGANPNTARSTGETPLMTASRTGNTRVVNVLLAAGADVNAKETLRGQTALMWALSEKHLDVVRVLMAHGADVSARSKAGFTPLLFAAREGDLDAVRFLLPSTNVQEAAADGTTALLTATVRGHTPVVRFLLEHGADPNTDAAGYTALHWAAGSVESALTGPFGIVAESGEWSVLGGLRGETKRDIVRALLAHGANRNARLTKDLPQFGYSNSGARRLAGATPFLLAAKATDVEAMDLLFASGADMRMATDEGTTPLMFATGVGRVFGHTPITESDALETVRWLVEHGSDVDAANNEGTTALHGAAIYGHDTIVKFLVANGAHVNARDKSGRTPLNIAQGFHQSGSFRVNERTAALLRQLGGE